MKTLLCVAVLALVASTIASPLPHRAAINNHHLLDNNVRELLQLLDNIQEEKVSAEKQEEEEVATSPPSNMLHDDIASDIIQLLGDIQQKIEQWKKNPQLSEVVDDIDKVIEFIRILQILAKEKAAMAQSPAPPGGK